MSNNENLVKAAELAAKNHKATMNLGLFSERTVNIMKNTTGRLFTFSLLMYGSYLGVSVIHNKLVMPYVTKKILSDKKIAELLMKG